jgi:nicotinamidase-related amidase
MRDKFGDISRLGVLVVDMQPGFLYRDGREPLVPNSSEELIGRHREIINFCVEKDIPVAFTINTSKCAGDLVEPLSIAAEEVPRSGFFKRYRHNGFDDNVKGFFENEEVDNLFLMGVNLSCCVLKTAQCAYEEGFSVSTAGDVTSDLYSDRYNRKNGKIADRGQFSVSYFPNTNWKVSEGHDWFRQQGALFNTYREMFV